MDNASGPVAASPVAAGIRVRVWLRARHFSSRTGADCWLWLAREDGRVHALQLPLAAYGEDVLLPRLLASLDADAEAPFELAGLGRAIPLPRAPVVPLPRWQVSWGHPVQHAIRAFAAELDAVLLTALGGLETAGAYFGSLTNYNLLVTAPPACRHRRAQALSEFPALAAPLLLEGFPDAVVFANRMGAERRWPAPYRDERAKAVLDAMDRGRDLIGALARYWKIDRALVRGPLLRQAWQRGHVPERELRLLAAMPAHARPSAPEQVEAYRYELEVLPVEPRSEADWARFGCVFAHGWEKTWRATRRGARGDSRHWRDTRDFLASALAQIGPEPAPDWLDEPTLALGWLVRRGPVSLLRASERWHAQPLRDVPDEPDLPRAIPPLFGSLAMGPWRAEELTRRAALVAEGKRMHNCVADYWRACMLYGTRIVHLTLADGEQATLEVALGVGGGDDRCKSRQLAGLCNRAVSGAMEIGARQLLAFLNAPSARDARERVREAARQALAAWVPPREAPVTRALDRRSRAELRTVVAWCRKQADWRTRPAFLRRLRVAGFAYRDDAVRVAAMARGDALTLVAEPSNRHDYRAVRIEWRGRKIGYVPRDDNVDIARRLAAGEKLTAVIRELRGSIEAPTSVNFDVYRKPACTALVPVAARATG